jgi:hypothetical protein
MLKKAARSNDGMGGPDEVVGRVWGSRPGTCLISDTAFPISESVCRDTFHTAKSCGRRLTLAAAKDMFRFHN